MARMIKVIGLFALFHLNNAAGIKCVTTEDFISDNNKDHGTCELVDSKDAKTLSITENWLEQYSSHNILPFTHYTTPHPTSMATQDFVHFKEEEKPLQAYTYYNQIIEEVTICSPYECIQYPATTTGFFITPSTVVSIENCLGKIIRAYNSSMDKKIIGVCVTSKDPRFGYAVHVESTPSAVFYLSREPAAKYHIIDHRSSPPVEVISEKVKVYSVGESPSLSLVHLLDYHKDYISNEGPPSPPLTLGVTGTYFDLQQRKDRRYMLQTPTNLYSLTEFGSSLSLVPEEENFFVNNSMYDRKRRIILQVFPAAFTLPQYGFSPPLRYSALYKEAYGYENRKVDRTITGAYALMAAVGYAEAYGYDETVLKLQSRETARNQYAQVGATYIYSMPTHLRCHSEKEELKELKESLEYYGNKLWDQVAQGAPLNDVEKTIHPKDAEGGALWYSEEEIEAIDKAKGNNTPPKGDKTVVDKAENKNNNVPANTGNDKSKDPVNTGNDKSEDEDVDNKDQSEEEDVENKDQSEKPGKGKPEDTEKKGWKNNLWKVACVLFLIVAILSVIVFFARRQQKKPSVSEIQPSSALLTHEEQQII